LLLLGLVDIELRGGVLVWAALTMPAEPLAEADALRAKRDQPRSRFASFAEAVEELRAVAAEIADLKPEDDPDRIEALAYRANDAAGWPSTRS